jgi:hypothetical protein
MSILAVIFGILSGCFLAVLVGIIGRPAVSASAGRF